MGRWCCAVADAAVSTFQIPLPQFLKNNRRNITSTCKSYQRQYRRIVVVCFRNLSMKSGSPTQRKPYWPDPQDMKSTLQRGESEEMTIMHETSQSNDEHRSGERLSTNATIIQWSLTPREIVCRRYAHHHACVLYWVVPRSYSLKAFVLRQHNRDL